MKLCNLGLQEGWFTFMWDQWNMKVELQSNGANVDKKNYRNWVLYKHIHNFFFSLFLMFMKFCTYGIACLFPREVE